MNERRIVLITGATRGIGLAVADAFAQRGDVVAFCGGRDEARLAEAEQALRRVQPDAAGILLDVRNSEAVRRWVYGVADKWGRIDVAIANAGTLRPCSFLDIGEDQWDEVVDTNLKGTFLFLQAAARTMVERRVPGSLITVTAPSAVQGSTGVADYASAKAGIIALTKNLAKELTPWGIRVNAVLPVAETRMSDLLRDYRHIDRASWAGQHPRGHVLEPADVVGPFLFLADPGARFVSGQVLAVDQGHLA